MAEKIITFNGKTLSGPNGGGGGMVTIKVPPFYGDGVTIGGRKYKTVIIGSQEWIAENLDYKFDGLNFRDSESNPMDTSTDAQAAYYNYEENTYGINGNKYGLLYNWYAVDYLNKHLEELDVPAGWHVPTRAEWDTLVSTVGQNPGKKLKSATGWTVNPGTNTYGFSAVATGVWSIGFNYLGVNAHFWTSEADTSGVSNAWYRFMDRGYNVTGTTAYRYYGKSLRLVKDLT